MKLLYIIPALALAACAKPEPVYEDVYDKFSEPPKVESKLPRCFQLAKDDPLRHEWDCGKDEDIERTASQVSSNPPAVNDDDVDEPVKEEPKERPKKDKPQKDKPKDKPKKDEPKRDKPKQSQPNMPEAESAMRYRGEEC